MFTKARLKLTGTYTVLMLAITCSISFLFYRQTIGQFERQFERIQERFASEKVILPRSVAFGHRLMQESLEDAKHQVVIRLVTINVLLGLGVAIMGFLLADQTLEPIEKALEQQKRFVQDASHELKTPITAMRTGLEVELRGKKTTKREKEFMEGLLFDVERLQDLVGNLLSLASGGQRLEMQNVGVGEIVGPAVAQMSSVAKAKKVELKLSGVKKDLFVFGDRAGLVEVLVVFLDNAIKFSKKGDVVGVEVKSKGRWVEFVVSDNGVGISSENQKKIFDRFFQADMSRCDEGSCGLGLAVAKQIVEDHEGKIWVKSVLGAGSRFGMKIQA